MSKIKDFDILLWRRMKEKNTMQFPYEESDGTVSEDYQEHDMYEDGCNGR